MKKKKMISKVLVVMMAVVMCSVMLCSCGSGSPTKSTREFLEGLKENDPVAIKDYYAGDAFNVGALVRGEAVGDDDNGIYTKGEVNEMIMDKLLDFEYVVGDEKINGNKATVKVEITTYPMGDAASAILSEYVTQSTAAAKNNATTEELQKLASSIFKSKWNNMTERSYTDTVTVSLSKVDGKWVIDEMAEDDPFYDAISGGMYSYIDSLLDIFAD